MGETQSAEGGFEVVFHADGFHPEFAHRFDLALAANVGATAFQGPELPLAGDLKAAAIVVADAAGAGLGAIFTPSGYGTQLAEGKETRNIDGRDYVLEYPIRADFALIKARRGDRWGNLVYRKTARNFGPIMAMAARCTIAQVAEIVPLGELDPEAVVTPGIFVKRIVAAGIPQQEAA